MEYEFSYVLGILLLTALAGLATGLGGLVVFFMKETNTRLLTYALGFSGGVMIYISMVELLGSANLYLVDLCGEKPGGLWTIVSFFGGIGLAALIDKCVPEDENPHEMIGLDAMKKLENAGKAFVPKSKMKRSGVLFALAIGIHNFPEGIATFAAGMNSLSLGISIALAVAVHNIPEGMVVAVPLFFGTGSRKKAIFYSFLSGLAEPLGAVLAMLVILPLFGMSPLVLAVLFASVAGIMVYISFDELLPLAEKWGHHHISTYGIISGMFLMALVLL